MPIEPRRGLVPAILVMALAAGCGSGAGPGTSDAQESPPAGTSAGDSRSARTLSIPGTSAPPASPHGAAGSVATLAWDVPPGWIVEKPRSTMRFAQYRVPGAAGEGECVVFYFGPGQGGDAASNAARWAGQFEQPDGGSAVDAMKTETLEGTAVPVLLVSVTGTYDGGMTMTDAPAEKQPGSMLLGGIAEGSDAPWFFKFTGPEATVRAERAAFVKMMGSIRVGGP